MIEDRMICRAFEHDDLAPLGINIKQTEKPLRSRIIIIIYGCHSTIQLGIDWTDCFFTSQESYVCFSVCVSAFFSPFTRIRPLDELDNQSRRTFHEVQALRPT